MKKTYEQGITDTIASAKLLGEITSLKAQIKDLGFVIRDLEKDKKALLKDKEDYEHLHYLLGEIAEYIDYATTNLKDVKSSQKQVEKEVARIMKKKEKKKKK